MNICNLATTGYAELMFRSGTDLAAYLLVPDDYAGVRVERPGGTAIADGGGEPVEVARAYLVEQDFIGLFGGAEWGPHAIVGSWRPWLAWHVDRIERGAATAADSDAERLRLSRIPPDFDGVIALDVGESFGLLYELATPERQVAWQGYCWRYTNIPASLHHDVAREYDVCCLNIAVHTVRAFKRRWPRARVGITTIPGGMIGTPRMADAHRGLFYSGAGKELAARTNNALAPILNQCDLVIANGFLRAQSDETAPRGVEGPAGIDPWWQRQELPWDCTEAYLAGDILEARRLAGPDKPLHVLTMARYAVSQRGPKWGMQLTHEDAARLVRVAAACGAEGILMFDSVADEGERSARRGNALAVRDAIKTAWSIPEPAAPVGNSAVAVAGVGVSA